MWKGLSSFKYFPMHSRVYTNERKRERGSFSFICSHIDSHRAVTRALLEHPSGHSREKHEGVARFPLRYNSVVNFDRSIKPSLARLYISKELRARIFYVGLKSVSSYLRIWYYFRARCRKNWLIVLFAKCQIVLLLKIFNDTERYIINRVKIWSKH